MLHVHCRPTAPSTRQCCYSRSHPAWHYSTLAREPALPPCHLGTPHRIRREASAHRSRGGCRAAGEGLRTTAQRCDNVHPSHHAHASVHTHTTTASPRGVTHEVCIRSLARHAHPPPFPSTVEELKDELTDEQERCSLTSRPSAFICSGVTTGTIVHPLPSPDRVELVSSPQT